MVGACEANQAAWNEAVAVAGGGRCWEDDGLRWAWQAHDGHVMLSFPQTVDPGALARGVAAAADLGARRIGAWLGAETDAGALERAGFRRGWEPWWMAARADAIAAPDDPRVQLAAAVPEYGPEGQALLALARGPEARAWHAAARVDGAFAGRAWSFVAGDVAGIYDMDVWPAFRRAGLGRALLRVVAAAARGAGARTLVLNATPDGAPLYAAEGFIRVGTGITYWRHLRG